MRVLRGGAYSGPDWRRALPRAVGALAALSAVGMLVGASPSGSEAAPLAQQDPVRTGAAYWYGRYGCIACHGGRGEGTPIAPAIAGRPDSPLSGESIVRQTRAPLLLMPDYPPDVLSDAQLQAIALYIQSFDAPR